MKETRKNRAIKNIVYSTMVKILTFAIGIIIPRLIIVGYGSEVNGLLQTISSIYSYLALIMAGVGTAAIQGLYKPISQDDKKEVSAVLVATKQYFHRLVRWYGLGVIIFSVAYPFFVKSAINQFAIFAVIFLEGFSAVLTYYFTYTVQAILSADGKDYVIQIIQFIVFVITSVTKVILILIEVNIVILQLAYLLINIFQITIYQVYIKKTYAWINWKEEPNNEVLKNRKHFLLNGVAWTVFNSTDTIVISTFCGLMFSSVYALYNMVFANLNLVFAIFYNSIYFLLGQVYHENKKRYIKLHDGFESCISALVFSVLSIAYILILPFFELYTRGIRDINYIDAHLPLLFCFVQILSNCRMISGNLINLTNNPKMTNKASIMEVIINLCLSIILAKLIGIYGVLIATIVALAFKTNYIIVVSNRKLLKRPPTRAYGTLVANVILFGLIMVFTKYTDLGISNYSQFLAWGAVLCLIIIPLYFVVNFIINPSAARLCIQIIRNKYVKE